MARLQYGVRNIPPKYEYRAICYIESLIEILNRALDENIKMYMIVFAYDEKLYSVGYDNFNDLNYFVGLPDGNTVKYSSVYELRSNLNFNHNVTVLREFQYETISKTIEVDIKDNYMLTNNLISMESDTFNYNMSTELINEYNELIAAANKDNKKMIMYLVGGLLFVIVVIAIVFVLNK